MFILTRNWSPFRPHHIFTEVGNKVTKNVTHETGLPMDHEVE